MSAFGASRPVLVSEPMTGSHQVSTFPLRVEDREFAVRNWLPIVEMIESFEVPKT